MKNKYLLRALVGTVILGPYSASANDQWSVEIEAGAFYDSQLVVDEIDSVLVYALQQAHRQLLEAALCVTHRSRWVVDRPEVPLGGHQRVAAGEVLAQPDQGVVDGVVAVGVEPTHHLTDHPGTLAEAAGHGPARRAPARLA